MIKKHGPVKVLSLRVSKFDDNQKTVSPGNVRLDGQHLSVDIAQFGASSLKPGVFEEEVVVQGPDLPEVDEAVSRGHLVGGVLALGHENGELVVVNSIGVFVAGQQVCQ